MITKKESSSRLARTVFAMVQSRVAEYDGKIDAIALEDLCDCIVQWVHIVDSRDGGRVSVSQLFFLAMHLMQGAEVYDLDGDATQDALDRLERQLNHIKKKVARLHEGQWSDTYKTASKTLEHVTALRKVKNED